MKKYYFSFFFVFITLFMGATPEKIVVIDPGAQHNHGEYFDPADMPEVFYDNDVQEIILVADGFVSSYDVNIVSLSTLQLVLHSTANGYGDTIDVSSLPNDDYKIVISTPYNNVYVGFFTNY